MSNYERVHDNILGLIDSFVNENEGDFKKDVKILYDEIQDLLEYCLQKSTTQRVVYFDTEELEHDIPTTDKIDLGSNGTGYLKVWKTYKSSCEKGYIIKIAYSLCEED